MPKILKFTSFAWREAITTFGPMVLSVLAVCYFAYRLIDPTPPNHVSMLTGPENSSYAEFGARYASALAKYHIRVDLKPSAGSEENLERLSSENQDVDIGFVRSGSIEQAEAERRGLISIGSLFSEPVWLFYRSNKELTDLAQLRKLRINVGPDGSGVPSLVSKLLDANGIEMKELVISKLRSTPATVELLEGRIDGVFFSSAPNSPLIQMLLQTPGIRLFDFTQAEAYTRRFPYLTHVVLPRGIVDLGHDIPSRDYNLIAPTATLVARSSLHPALVDLYVQAAEAIHGGAGWFNDKSEYPSANYVEIPVAPDADKFYKRGTPVLQHYLPFWLANFFDRMWVVIVALGALILPLSKILPPIYIWRIRSRIYRWYGQLRVVEQSIDDVPPEQRQVQFKAQLKQLQDIEDKVNQISVPLSFAEQLYGLRNNIHFVRERIERSLAEHDQSDRAVEVDQAVSRA